MEEKELAKLSMYDYLHHCHPGLVDEDHPGLCSRPNRRKRHRPCHNHLECGKNMGTLGKTSLNIN